MYSSFEIGLGNNKVEDICTAPDRVSPTKVCALVSAMVVVNSRLFVTPNVEANRPGTACRHLG